MPQVACAPRSWANSRERHSKSTCGTFVGQLLGVCRVQVVQLHGFFFSTLLPVLKRLPLDVYFFGVEKATIDTVFCNYHFPLLRTTET